MNVGLVLAIVSAGVFLAARFMRRADLSLMTGAAGLCAGCASTVDAGAERAIRRLRDRIVGLEALGT